MPINNYSFDDITIPQPPVQIDTELIDYVSNKLPQFLNTQYLSLLDFVSAVQNAFLVSNAQILDVGADKIINDTQFVNNVFVGAESKIALNGLTNQITITDSQGSPVTRVILGKLSSTSDDYGIKIIDASGAVKFQSGSTTVMDGGIITANTITATQINANTITATEIAANTITATELAADSVTATEIDVANLSAISADLGTVTAGTITGGTIRTSSSNPKLQLDSTGIYAYKADGTNTAFIGNDGQFRFGTASGDRVEWNNTTLSVTGDIISTGNIEDGAITLPTVTTGTSSDGSNIDLTVSTKGGNVIGILSIEAVIRGATDAGISHGKITVTIDGNTAVGPATSACDTGSGSTVTPRDLSNGLQLAFIDGDPNGSITSAADTTYTVSVAITKEYPISGANGPTMNLISYTAKLVTLETFK